MIGGVVLAIVIIVALPIWGLGLALRIRRRVRR